MRVNARTGKIRPNRERTEQELTARAAEKRAAVEAAAQARVDAEADADVRAIAPEREQLLLLADAVVRLVERAGLSDTPGFSEPTAKLSAILARRAKQAADREAL